MFCRGLQCHSYILLIFQSSLWISFVEMCFVVLYLVTVTFSWFSKVHFGFLSLKCKSWNISVVFCCALPCHSYILLIFQSSFWISFVEMQELEYFSSVLSWFTLSQLHSLDFSKFILDFYILLIFQSLFWSFFRWNARFGIFQ